MATTQKTGSTKTAAAKAAGRKVAAKKAAVTSAKVTGLAKRQARKDEQEVTPAKGWKKTEGYALEVPSGNVALVRPVGMEAFLAKGLIPNSLREIAMESITKKKAPELKVEDLTGDQIEDMMTLFNAVTVFCTVKPVVKSIPQFTAKHLEDGLCDEDEVGTDIPMAHEARNENMLYVDEVDLEDKVFIFQYACGGTRNLETFRAQYASNMERVSGVSDVADQAE